MTTMNEDKIDNPLFKLALKAMKRAAIKAQEQALIHNTQLIIWRDDRVVKLSPDKISEQRANYQVVGSIGKDE